MTYLEALEASQILVIFSSTVLVWCAVFSNILSKTCLSFLDSARDHAWFWENQYRQVSDRMGEISGVNPKESNKGVE